MITDKRVRLDSAFTKRTWRLQDECDAAVDNVGTSGCKKHKDDQEAVLIQVEEASLKCPKLFK